MAKFIFPPGTTTVTYDMRDSRVEPRSGYVVRVGGDYAGIGGDVNYFRSRADAKGVAESVEQVIVAVPGAFAAAVPSAGVSAQAVPAQVGEVMSLTVAATHEFM